MCTTFPELNCVQILTRLAQLYREQWRLGEAVALGRDVVARMERLGGENSQTMAGALAELGGVLADLGRFSEAEQVLRQAGVISKRIDPHAGVLAAIALGWEATYVGQGRLADAETVAREAVKQLEALVGEMHPLYADSLTEQAILLRSEGFPERALPMVRRAAWIYEKCLGPASPRAATAWAEEGRLAYLDRKYAAAEELFRKSLVALEESIGVNHPNVISLRYNLAMAIAGQGRYEEAEPAVLATLAYADRQSRPSLSRAHYLSGVASFYAAQGDHGKATGYYRDSISEYRLVDPKIRDLPVLLRAYAKSLKRSDRAAARRAEHEAVLLTRSR
jgi:tetratricopeptide (TPR) repeat protein